MLEKSIYKTRQELFEVIDYDNSLVYNQFDTFEFLSVYNPLNCKKNWCVKQAKRVKILALNEDINIDCLADEIEI